MDAKKALFRAKLREAAQKREKRIDSPLLRYNEYDQPICKVCNVTLKSESLWPAHQVSRKHHEAIENMKALAAARADTKLDQPKDLQKSRPSSALPPDFFDNPPGSKKQKTGTSGAPPPLPDVGGETGLVGGEEASRPPGPSVEGGSEASFGTRTSSTSTSGSSSSSSSSSSSEEGEFRMNHVDQATFSLSELSKLMEVDSSAELPAFAEGVRTPTAEVGIPGKEVPTIESVEETPVEAETSATSAPLAEERPTLAGSCLPVPVEGSSCGPDPPSDGASGSAQGADVAPMGFPALGVEWPDAPALGMELHASMADQLLQSLDRLIQTDPLPAVEALRANLEMFTRSYHGLGLPRDAWAAKLRTLWDEFARLYLAQEQRQAAQLLIQQEEEELCRLRAAQTEADLRLTGVEEHSQRASLRVEALRGELEALQGQLQGATEEHHTAQAEAEACRRRSEELREEISQRETRLAERRRGG